MTCHSCFDAILFDCDGVLVDSEPITHRVLAEMLAEQGWAISLEDASRIFTGKTVRDESARISAHTGKPVTDAWLAEFWQRRNVALENELVEITGAGQAVRTLHQAFDGRIAVASGADRRKVELQLRKTGMFDYFQERICSGHEQPRNKPFPDVYLAAAKMLGADPARCVVVEDTVTGTQAGVAAGATVFGYSPGGLGHSTAQDLLDAGASRIFRDMAELPALVAAGT